MPQKPNNTDPQKPRIIRINLSWLYIILLLAIGYMLFSQSGPSPQKIEWPQVRQMMLDGDVKEIHFVRNDFKGTVTVQPDRLGKYADMFAGGKVPSRSPHFFFLTSTRFDPESEFAEVNAALPADAQVKVLMENDGEWNDSVVEAVGLTVICEMCFDEVKAVSTVRELE